MRKFVSKKRHRQAPEVDHLPPKQKQTVGKSTKSIKKERPESEAFSLYYSDQITLTRSTASRAVRSASRAAGIAPVTSKMV